MVLFVFVRVTFTLSWCINLFFSLHSFPKEIGTVQIALANFVGSLVKVFPKRMIQLILHHLLAVSAKKNVIIFYLLGFEHFLFASVYFSIAFPSLHLV